MATVALTDLAEDWLVVKALTGSPSSTRVRRADLCRWGRALRTVTGHDNHGEAREFDTAVDLAELDSGVLTYEHLIRALSSMRVTYASSTVSRSVSTLRGWCRWMVRRGYLDVDPTIDDTFVVSRVVSGAPGVAAFDETEVAALRAAAASPGRGARAAWPARDVAIVDVLSGCGLRAAELVGLRDTSIDADMLRVVWGAKGGKRRDVPLPARVVVSLDVYRSERAQLDVKLSDDLFVRRDGTALSTATLDRLVRRFARDAGVATPPDAATHAFRHHYGVQLAVRRVPLVAIQQLMGHADPRTTTGYTRLVGTHLVDALEDAGWM